jgi:shikimate dehydrogenase
MRVADHKHPGIDTATQVCAVIGNPVAHSLSPAMHNAGFAASGLNYVYTAFHVEDVGAALTGMRALRGFRGMSVTIPHKESIIACLDEVEPLALEVGSVNTVTSEDGRLIGSTTDGPGTLRAFEEAGVSLAGKEVVFMGTGGAVRAVAFAMAAEAGVAGIRILGRTPANVARLVSDLTRHHGAVPVTGGSLGADLQAATETGHVLVNGTPLGMYPEHEGETVLPAGWMRADHVVFDMVYRPKKTRLILEAEALGCTVILGLEMLLNQAVLQFERWTGVAAPRDAMRAALVAALDGDTPRCGGEDRS